MGQQAKAGQLAERCFNIIDSVKGGSGKSSLSLMLALAAQKYMQDSEDPSANYSLLMDMDMQGSSLDYLLFGNDASAKAKATLNDAILKYYTKETPQFISNPKFYFSDDIGGVPSDGDEVTAGEGAEAYQIAVALASTKIDDRNRFRAVSRMNYSSQITYDAFGSGLKAILKDANLNSYLSTRPQYVFFDMPPNSNGYSDCILELLLSSGDRKASAIASEYPRNYFELMTLDRGHIGATLDWFQQFVEQEQYHFPDHFFFVFSNIPKSISEMEYDSDNLQFKDECLRNAISEVQKRLDDFNLKEEQRARIRIVGISYQKEYLKRCCGAGTLASSSAGGLNRGLLFPVKFLMDLQGKNDEDTKITEKLLRLMCTKD